MPIALRIGPLLIAVVASPLANASYSEACILEGKVLSHVSVKDGSPPAVHFSLAVETARRDDTSALLPDASCSFWIGKEASVTLQERIPLDMLPSQGSTVRVLTEAVAGSTEGGEVILRTFRFIARLDSTSEESSSNIKLQRAGAR
jgi:hypothetical protein